MAYRLADGGDKIAAFERGASDDEMHLAFETPGVTAYIVDESYLVAYGFYHEALVPKVKRKLYDTGVGEEAVKAFLADEARVFGCRFVW